MSALALQTTDVCEREATVSAQLAIAIKVHVFTETCQRFALHDWRSCRRTFAPAFTCSFLAWASGLFGQTLHVPRKRDRAGRATRYPTVLGSASPNPVT